MAIFISQEANGLSNHLALGGEAALGGQYVSCVDNNNLRFGIYQAGQTVIGASITQPGVTASGGLSMAANGSQHGIQHMVANVSQPVFGSGSAPAFVLYNSAVISGASSNSPSVIASSLDVIGVTQVSAVAWTGINPPPPGNNQPFQYRYYGNVNVATDYGSPGNYAKAPANNAGIPNAYAAEGPVITFRGRTLYVGYVGTDQSNTFNLWSSTEASQYETFVTHLTPIAGQLPMLGVQGNKLVLAWIDGNRAIHMGYWNGEPSNGGFDWQDVLMRHVPGGPDQPVTGGTPLMSQSGNGLILSWGDAQFGPSTGFVTLP